MELDELKLQIRQKLDDASTSKSEADIGFMLKKNTQSIVNKLTRSLWIENIACIAFFIIFGIVGLTTKHWGLKIYFSTFSIMCLLFFFVLFYLINKIKKLEHGTLPVKNNLQLIHSIIKEYAKRNFQLTMALIPVCMIFALWLGYKDSYNDIHFSNSFLANRFQSTTKVYLLLALYVLVVGVGIYYVTKWYLKKLYGNYLSKLQQYINELDSN